MAEETQSKAEEAPAQEVVVTEAAPQPAEEKEVVKDPPPPPPPAPEPEDDPKKPAAEPAEEEKKASVGEPPEKEKTSAGARAVPPSISFKEESNLVADLDDPEKKALDELKQLVRAALANGEFSPAPPPTPQPAAGAPAEEPISEQPVSAEPPPEPVAKEAEEQAPEEAPKAPEEEAPQAPEEEAPQAPVEKPVVVDEDGAKTVEAIEETVVAVATAAPPAAEEETAPVAAEEETPAAPAPSAAEEVLLWGVPLLSDDRSDTILLKFLRARDFKAKDAMAMLKSAVLWRKEFGIEALLEEDLGVPEMGKAVFMHGVDKEGHPVCYNVYGEFQDKELYAAAFADAEKRQRFLRWRIQFLEKGIRELLDFKPDGVSTMVQVTDLKNSPGPAKRELRQALTLLQDNYPEFAAKQVFINVPWWYLAFNRMISPFLTQRTTSKFVFAGPSKSAETLFKYIAPAQVPVQFGGLSEENDPEFSVADAVAEINLKPSMKQIIEIPVTQTCLLVWELRVLGWEVTYGAEFVPADGYTVIIQKARKYIATDEPVIKNSFKIGEAGKVVLTVDNTTSKKKKLLYRYKTKSSIA